MKLLKLFISEGYPEYEEEGREYDAIKLGTWNYNLGETYILVDNLNQGVGEVIIKEFHDEVELGYTGFTYEITKIYTTTVTKVIYDPIKLDKDPEKIFNLILNALGDGEFHDSTELEMISPYWEQALEWASPNGYIITISNESLPVYKVGESTVYLPKTTIRIQTPKR